MRANKSAHVEANSSGELANLYIDQGGGGKIMGFLRAHCGVSITAKNSLVRIRGFVQTHYKWILCGAVNVLSCAVDDLAALIMIRGATDILLSNATKVESKCATLRVL
jgi:hypothetical protein